MLRLSRPILLLLMTLSAWVACSPAKATPQFTTLHRFSALVDRANSDGAYPQNTLLVQGSDGNLYGTVEEGGSFSDGAVFKITPAGTLTTLYSFSALGAGGANNDGAGPLAGLVQGNDGNFYGTTSGGGISDNGTVFKITPSGTLTTLYKFTGGADGGNPESHLIQGSDGDFYGADGGGSGGSTYGTVFKITSSGSLTTLAAFTKTNGAGPSSLVQGSDGSFYGTTFGGGANNTGTVFAVAPSGTLTTLHDFTAESYLNNTNNDGASPSSGLIQSSDGNFYGTTFGGGAFGNGTVFKVTSSGTLTTLHDFSAVSQSFPGGNGDGSDPNGSLVQGSDGNFYGTTFEGGAFGNGTVFKITPSGALTTLHDFSALAGSDPNVSNSDGIYPDAGLLLGSDGNFYGTTFEGGANNTGTVFKITAQSQVICSFPSANGGFISGLAEGTDGNFYGTTNGGTNNEGTVFKATPSGTLTTLYNFSAENALLDNSDGANPIGALVQGADGNFYGTAYAGGLNDEGTIFKVTPSGTLTTLHNFSSVSSSPYPMEPHKNSDGANPLSALIEGSDGNFYGTATSGGSGGYGTVFKVTPTGTVTTLANFDGSNGNYPYSTLIRETDGSLYGTTYEGGILGDGTAFAISVSGVLTTLVDFDAGRDFPNAMIQGQDGNFYGTTFYGGGPPYPGGSGTVFRITSTGTIAVLTTFNATSTGANPNAIVQGSDGNFYGTTASGGFSSGGTVFQLSPSGSLTALVNFSGAIGQSPSLGFLLGRDGNFYGTTDQGGASGNGTIYRVTGPPQGFGSAQSSTENTSITFTVAFNDPSGLGIDSVAFPTLPAHGTIALVPGSITETGTTGTAAVTYTPTAGYHGADSFAYTVTGYTGLSSPQTVTVTVTPPPGPTVGSLSPTSGPVGTIVTITGTNLNDVTAVRFHNANATVFSANPAGTQVTATVPNGALAGTIRVTTPTGSVQTATQFTVIATPTVSSITPASGPIGTVVTITGTNLSGVTAVRFHNANATVFSANPAGTQVTTTVPNGALTGTIRVTTPTGSVQTATQFTVTP